MRVITGTARGRKLAEPSGNDIRPTTAQVKEAMFNILQFDIEGRRVLDLFGGTGQLGLEAASRGAREVLIADSDRRAIELIRENIRRAGVNAKAVQTDALALISRGGSYDLILLDPPYDSNLAEEAIDAIKAFDILSEGGIILCETRRGKTLPALEAPYTKGREYRYGKVQLTVYTKGSESHVHSDLSGQL